MIAVHGANMGPIWGWQDPGGPHVGPMNLAIWVTLPEPSILPLFSQNILVWVSEGLKNDIKYVILKFCINTVYKNKYCYYFNSWKISYNIVMFNVI